MKDMYIDISPPGSKRPEYRCKRGSSSLEGWHNHGPKALRGSNTSPALARPILALMQQQWNVKAAIKNRGEPNYGTLDLRPLYEVSGICQRNAWEDPFPLLRPLPAKPDLHQILDPSTIQADVEATAAALEEQAASAQCSLPHTGQAPPAFGTCLV